MCGTLLHNKQIVSVSIKIRYFYPFRLHERSNFVFKTNVLTNFLIRTATKYPFVFVLLREDNENSVHESVGEKKTVKQLFLIQIKTVRLLKKNYIKKCHLFTLNSVGSICIGVSPESLFMGHTSKCICCSALKIFLLNWNFLL